VLASFHSIAGNMAMKRLVLENRFQRVELGLRASVRNGAMPERARGAPLVLRPFAIGNEFPAFGVCHS
jgi:hypothetical protein